MDKDGEMFSKVCDSLIPPEGFRIYVWDPEDPFEPLPGGILRPVQLVFERISDGKLWLFKECEVS